MPFLLFIYQRNIRFYLFVTFFLLGSLKSLEASNADKIARVDSLIAYIESLPHFDFRAEADEIIKISASINYDEGLFMGNYYLSNLYILEEKYDSSVYFAEKMITFSENKNANLIGAYTQLITSLVTNEQIVRALETIKKLLYYAKLSSNKLDEAGAYYAYADIYNFVGDIEKEKTYLLKAIRIFETTEGDKESFDLNLPYLYAAVGDLYTQYEDLDSSFYYFSKAELLFEKGEISVSPVDKSLFYRYFGYYYLNQKEYTTAEEYCKKALKDELMFGFETGVAYCEICIATAKI